MTRLNKPVSEHYILPWLLIYSAALAAMLTAKVLWWIVLSVLVP
jgi:hypothetical protein